MPDRRLAMPHARAAPGGLARRPVAGRRRADDHPPRTPVGPAANSSREERGRIADRAQIAMVAVDNRTGERRRLAGRLATIFGRAGQVDLVRAHRSPGSALKPLIYAMAFDDRTLHPESLVEDVPVRFRDWLPRNFDRDHQGAVTVRRALQQSLNVPAVLALEKVGPAALPRRPCAPPARRPACRRATPATRWALRSAAPRSRRWRWPGLYAGLASGGSFAPPQVRRDRPRPRTGAPDRRRRRPGMSATCWPTRRCPKASPPCR